MSNRPRRFRHYDEEFKRSAGQLCLKGEKTVAELAEELGVSTGSLYGWRSQFLELREGHRGDGIEHPPQEGIFPAPGVEGGGKAVVVVVGGTQDRAWSDQLLPPARQVPPFSEMNALPAP